MPRLSLSLLLSFSIFASMSGKWSAPGYFFTEKDEGKCEEVFFQLERTKSKLKFITGGYSCGILKAEYPASEFNIVGEEILYQGNRAGTISKNEIKISYYDGVFQLNLKLEKDKLLFKERWYENGDLLVIQSQMKRN